jgi:hypothetical protein
MVAHAYSAPSTISNNSFAQLHDHGDHGNAQLCHLHVLACRGSVSLHLKSATVKLYSALVEGYPSCTQLKACGAVCWTKHVEAELAAEVTESLTAVQCQQYC